MWNDLVLMTITVFLAGGGEISSTTDLGAGRTRDPVSVGMRECRDRLDAMRAGHVLSRDERHVIEIPWPTPRVRLLRAECADFSWREP